MNGIHRKRLDTHLSEFEQVVLVTCGPAGPQAGQVACQMQDSQLVLCVPRTSDHLFNLEANTEVVVLSPGWELHGTGHLAETCPVLALNDWQAAVCITPTRLHILDEDGQKITETIDFERNQP